MSYTAHSETDEETGVTLKIIGDDDLQQPYGCDESVKIVVLHRRYHNPSQGELSSVDTVAEFEAENAAPDSEWFTVPLYMYDHSGTVYRVGQNGNPFSCQWDSGRVGIIALKRADMGADLLKIAQGVAEAYSDWANGHGYGFTVESPDGEHEESCWGYLGDHDAEGGALSEGREAFERVKAAVRADMARALEASRPDLAPAS